MTVRNEEKKAFRDMTPEERSEIVEALICGDVIEMVIDGIFQQVSVPGAIGMNSAYRTKPKQLVIPWGVIKPEYKWAAMDKDGCVFVTTQWMGQVDRDGYWIRRGGWLAVPALSIDTTGIDYRESLTERPEGV